MNDFEEWYRSQHQSLGSALAFSFGDRDLAAEVADEAIVRAYERWDQVSVMESRNGWLYRVAFNLARRRLRRRRLENLLLRPDRAQAPLALPTSGHPDHRELWALVADLPDRQRQAVALRHLGQLTEAEIGAAMGITRGTVSATLRSAHQSLRRALQEPRALQDPEITTEVPS